MAIQISFPWKFCGTNIQGDIDGLTLYVSSRGKVVAFLRAPPDKPPSADQTTIRNRWRAAGSAWAALPEPQRRNWLSAARRTSLRITGYNLFVYWITTANDATIRTIERQTGLQLITYTPP
jgi:hypothetical protein